MKQEKFWDNTESVRSIFCFWIGCGQQSRKLMCKDAVASGGRLFPLKNHENSHLETDSKFQCTLRTVSSLLGFRPKAPDS